MAQSKLDAASRTLSLISWTLKFDIVEIWTMTNGDAVCKSYFVSEALMALYPGLALVAPGVTSSWKSSSVKVNGFSIFKL